MTGATTAGPGPRVLVLSGGLVHLVNQLAVVIGLGEREGWRPGDLAVLVTGGLRLDAAGLLQLHRHLEHWFEVLRRQWPGACAGLRLVPDQAVLRPGEWEMACLNNLWQESQREHLERLAIPTVLDCGDAVGIYYRCGRELRALLPSLLGLPVVEPKRRLRLVLEGRQPLWHRPARPVEPVPVRLRARLFDSLAASLAPPPGTAGDALLPPLSPGRPLWLCSVPNLAHQFPGRRLPLAVLEAWLDRLEGFEPRQDRLVLIDHPKAPVGGSFGPGLPAAVAGPIRSALPLELLVRSWQQEAPQRPVIVAGMTSALVGVRRLTGAPVRWLALAPLWRANPSYRHRPQEFLHRWLRVRRMALLCREALPPTGEPC